jgi:hypothetical protein
LKTDKDEWLLVSRNGLPLQIFRKTKAAPVQ